MKIDVLCNLSSFRRFMILSTCYSFVPPDLLDDETVFPEREADKGTMYVEAEDKETLLTTGDIRFTRVKNVLGVIYNSKSGNTRLKWRHFKNEFGKLTGEASANTLVNLFTARVLDGSYLKAARMPHRNHLQVSDTFEASENAFSDNP